MTDDTYRPLRERLRAKTPRPLDRVREAIAHAPPAPISLSRAHELSAMAVGLLVLKHVEESGRTRLHEQAIQDTLKRITEHLTAAQMMRLEVEAYEIVDWLVGGNGNAVNAHFVAMKKDDGVEYDPSSSIPAIVREAVAQEFDLKITYYSAKRMEMNSRVISPKAIAAETYVRGWCHERRDERIFRMDRIRSAIPVGGKAIRNAYLERVLSEQHEAQQSLELEALSFAHDIGEAPLLSVAASVESSAESTPESIAEEQHPPWMENTESSAALTPTTSAKDGVRIEPASTASHASHAHASSELDRSTPIDTTGKEANNETAYDETAPQEVFSEEEQKALLKERRALRKRTEPLKLVPTPTDDELRRMDIEERRRQAEQEALEKAQRETETGEASDDDQLSFF